jgi:hypothetical protein
MAMRVRRRGTGITQRDELLAETAADTADMLRRRRGRNEDWIAEVEAVARAILVRAGRNPDKPGLRVGSMEDDSHEDYADRILRWLKICRGAISRNDAAEAANAGVQIGVLVAEHDLKAEWERPALSGERYQTFGKTGGRPTKLGRNFALAREYQKRRPGSGRSDTALMTVIGAEHGLKKSAATVAIKAGLKILPGKPAQPDGSRF